MPVLFTASFRVSASALLVSNLHTRDHDVYFAFVGCLRDGRRLVARRARRMRVSSLTAFSRRCTMVNRPGDGIVPYRMWAGTCPSGPEKSSSLATRADRGIASVKAKVCNMPKRTIPPWRRDSTQRAPTNPAVDSTAGLRLDIERQECQLEVNQ